MTGNIGWEIADLPFDVKVKGSGTSELKLLAVGTDVELAAGCRVGVILPFLGTGFAGGVLGAGLLAIGVGLPVTRVPKDQNSRL